MSGGQNYIIVNNEAGSAISDGVTDLVRYIDGRNKDSTESLAPLADEFKQALGPKASEELPLPSLTEPIFVKIAENAGSLLKAPPSEFESAFNLLWYVLSSAPDFELVIRVALGKLTRAYPTVHAQQLALLAVLGSLFNITAATSPEKPAVFSHIVDLAVHAHAADQFVPQLPQLAEWLQSWQISNEAKEKLVVKLADNVSTRHRASVREFLTAVVSTLPELKGVSARLGRDALTDPSVYTFDSLLLLPGVQSLKGNSDNIYEAMELISVGDYATFSKLGGEVVKQPVVVKKARATAIARLASSSKDNELSYTDISSALGVSATDVEIFIVDTIKAGLVRGRMNQLQQKFYIESATVIGPVSDHHWDTIESRLGTWKKSLSAILDVSVHSRSYHTLVKQLNKLEVN